MEPETRTHPLLALDERWTRSLRLRQEQRLLRGVAAVLAHSGDSWFWGAGLLLLIWRGDPALRTWALQLLIAISALAATVLAIKFTFRRRRPEGEWGAVYRMTDPHSFPSGHAARVFLIAALVAAWGPAWLIPIVWIWAPLVAWARVAMGLHYASDVAGGAVLGLAVALVAIRLVA
jgi:undecaprenyl-diphosphatase